MKEREREREGEWGDMVHMVCERQEEGREKYGVWETGGEGKELFQEMNIIWKRAVERLSKGTKGLWRIIFSGPGCERGEGKHLKI